MNKKNQTIASLATTLFLFLGSQEVSAIYKCSDKAGNVSYQETKCPTGINEKTLKISQVSSASNSAKSLTSAESSAVNDQDKSIILNLVSIHSVYDGCAEFIPSFSQRHASTFSAWRNANASALAKYENSASYRLMYGNGRKEILTMAVNAKEALTQHCEGRFIDSLERRTRK